MFYFECRAERRSHSSIFKTYVFECRAECRTHSSIFKVCFILNAELNVELTARYSRCMFSISQLDILIFLVLLVECRAEYRSHSSIFADYVCQYIAEYRFSIPLPTSQTSNICPSPKVCEKLLAQLQTIQSHKELHKRKNTLNRGK